MIEKGQIKEVDIIDVNYMGKGVAKVDDFVVFVDDAITCDSVLIKIKEVKKNFALGRPIKIIKKSTNRIDPPCQYFSQCGGCQLMHMDYKEQLIYKKNRVISELKRADIQFEDAIVKDTIGMDNPIRYRNKTAFSVVKKNDEINIGPYEQGTYNTVNILGCLLQSEEADKAVRLFKNLMIKNNIEPYDKRTGKGTVRNIVIRNNKHGELMLIIVTGSENFPNKDALVDGLISNIYNIKTVVQNVNSKDTNIIMGRKSIVLFGEGTINDTIGNLVFTISPDTFFQINPVQTEKLYNKAIEFANLNKDDICFDMYCGIGTISLMASKYAKKVYGVEIVEQSIANARENAVANNINNVDFYSGESEIILPMLFKQNIMADVIILDPPRKGCEKQVLDTIIEMSPARIVYVSCNPQTLSRDIKILESGGYELKTVQPLDQFPWTTHVECVVLISRV